MLDQQAQDLEETMQHLVQKGRDLHEQQQKVASLQKHCASLNSDQPMPEHSALAVLAGQAQGSKREYEQLQRQADNKARMVRYLSDQVQERSEDVWEAQQLMRNNSHDADAESVKQRAAR